MLDFFTIEEISYLVVGLFDDLVGPYRSYISDMSSLAALFASILPIASIGPCFFPKSYNFNPIGI